MNGPIEPGMGRCRSYLMAQTREQERRQYHFPGPGPAITMAYLTGAGEHEIADRVAEILKADEPESPAPWTVFDRQLIEQVLKEHSLPKEMARYISEDRRSFIQEEIDELLGLHPPAWIMVPHIAETVLRLADMGRVILVGRGAPFILARMANVFHVRLVAPLASRIERVQRTENLPPKEAAKFVAKNDRGRNRYLRAYFRGKVDDALPFHLVINTDRIPCPVAAPLIASQARQFFQRTANIAKPELEIASTSA
jgi:hypothetical protein